MRNPTRAALIAGVLTLTCATSGLAQKRAASAQSPKPPGDERQQEEARQAYAEAQAKFADGKYAAALGLYERAENLVPVSQTKYMIGVCLDKLGNAKEAALAYRVFLDSEPSSAMKDAVADATARLAALKQTPGRVRVLTEPASPLGLVITIDGKRLPSSGPVLLAPGRHTLAVRADGYEPVTQHFDLGFAESKQLRLSLREARRTRR